MLNPWDAFCQLIRQWMIIEYLSKRDTLGRAYAQIDYHEAIGGPYDKELVRFLKAFIDLLNEPS